MKTKNLPFLFSTAFLVAAGFNSQAAHAEVILPPSAATVSMMVTDPAPTPSAQVATSPEAAATQWIDIKDCTSEMRSAFFVGFGKLEAIVNHQINELTARRAGIRNPAAGKDLDLAIQNMGNARFFLAAMGELLGRATPQNWDREKTKVGLAWAKSQEVYATVKAPSLG